MFWRARIRYQIISFVCFALMVLVFFIIRFFTTPMGKLLLLVAGILLVGYVVFIVFLLDFCYAKYGVKFANKQFAINENTLRNDFCTIILTPGKQIVIMENDYNVNNEKRMFNIPRKDMKINKTWFRICKIFNDETNLDNLAAFFSIDMNVNIVIFDRKEVVQHDNNISKKKINHIKEDIDKPINVSESVNSDNMACVSSVDISDKINVNSADADTLALLPGINIIAAKKLIEYRNLNGLFQSEDEFIKAAGVKTHFIDKVKSMIILEQPQQNIEPDTSVDNGRIVDF